LFEPGKQTRVKVRNAVTEPFVPSTKNPAEAGFFVNLSTKPGAIRT
jgi:hypothetical protein